MKFLIINMILHIKKDYNHYKNYINNNIDNIILYN